MRSCDPAEWTSWAGTTMAIFWVWRPTDLTPSRVIPNPSIGVIENTESLPVPLETQESIKAGYILLMRPGLESLEIIALIGNKKKKKKKGTKEIVGPSAQCVPPVRGNIRVNSSS